MELSTLSELDQKQFLYELEDYIIAYRDKLNIEKKYSFGIEIEFVGCEHIEIERNVMPQFVNHFHLNHDSTLNDGNFFGLPYNVYGGELVSDSLSNKRESWQEIKQICELLKMYGGYINDDCGGHIHIGGQILKKQENF